MTAPRNPLAELWLQREHERLLHRELSELAQEIRRLNSETEPLRRTVAERRKERLRQDGANGFVMVPK